MSAKKERLLTPSEVANALAVSGQTVANWIERGALPAITLPHLPTSERLEYRIRETSLREALEGDELPADFFS